MANTNSNRNALHKLTDAKCQKAGPGRYYDGGGLNLQVKPNGTRAWTFRFTCPITGKRQDMGLGKYGKHDVTLAEARTKSAEARSLVREYRNPLTERKERLLELKRNQASVMTFRQCRDQYINDNKSAWRNAKHTAQWTSTLDTYAKQILDLPVAAIGQAEVLLCLRPIWTSKTETATRVRQRIEAVLAWATVHEYRRGDNPAQWKNYLDKILPAPTQLKKVKHRAALPWAETGSFMTELRNKDGLAAKALELQILTASRPNEVYGAKWSEFDLDAMLWTIPGERMKAKKEHEVPLSEAAVRLIKSLPRVSGNDHLFTGFKPGSHLTTAAGMKVLKSLRTGITAHGFRSTFRDWAANSTAFPREVIEHALAHQLKDKAEAAYARSTLLPKRTKLMEAWADYCSRPAVSADVTPIGVAK